MFFSSASHQTAIVWGNRLSASLDARALSGARYEAQLAADAWRRIEEKYGRTAHSRALLSRATEYLGDFAQAASMARDAHQAARATELASFAAMAKAFAKATGRRAYAIRRFPGNEHLVVLSAKRDPEEGFFVHGATLDEVDWMNGKLRLCQSRSLEYEGFDECRSLGLAVVDMDKDGQLEIVTTQNFPGASWSPSIVDVFSTKSGKWAILDSFFSHDPALVGDFNHDGRIEISICFPVGSSPSHALQPRWINYYSLQRGKRHLVNTRFPETYRSLRQEIRRLRKRRDKFYYDEELMHFEAQCDRILGERRRGDRMDRRAHAEGWKGADFSAYLDPRSLHIGKAKKP